MSKVRYEGPDRLLFHEGVPYDVSDGDVLDLSSVPDLPGFSEANEDVKTKEATD